jgi:phospholipid-binding lipoprotein MlaA
MIRSGWIRLVAVVALLGLLQACATTTGTNPRDPLESVNRKVFLFNDAMDQAVVKPVATVYRDVVPSWTRKGVSNFFNNLEDAWSVVNNAVQGRPQQTGESMARVMVNTTLGLGGLLDLATSLNLERQTSTFGYTLGRWGLSPGPYVVLPVLGPATMREVVGLPVDWKGSPISRVPDRTASYSLKALSLVDLRVVYLGADDVLAGAALDKYSFTRDSYLQRQRNIFYDGNPPEEEEEPLN